jgi:hypothetical protein
MNSNRLSFIGVLALLVSFQLATRAKVVLWDTMAPNAAGNPEVRGGWRAVPSNLMLLEKEPVKASSDPGYYGREYRFVGSPVVENEVFIAAFSPENGNLTLFSKNGEATLVIHPPTGSAARGFELVRNEADEVALNLLSSAGAIRVSFGKNEIIEIAPNMATTFKISAPIEYAVVPGFVADDLIFGVQEDASVEALAVPSEGMMMGLLKGEGRTVTMTWPSGKQLLRLNLGGKENKRPIESITFENAGQPFYIAVSRAPGIWHREELSASYLEKDVTSEWKRPFAAKWQTQLLEGAVRTTFPFHDYKGTVWRGVAGMLDYPVRFEGAQAIYHLSKKVPPKGESVVYFLEGDDTPANVLTPVDILRATLGRAAAEKIVDVEGRKLRTHHGAAGSEVHRACTCGYTEAMQAVFEKGEEMERKAFINESIEDMIYFVQRHLARIDEYRNFAKELGSFVAGRAKERPELKAYLDEIEQAAQQIPAEYENQKENMKSLEYAGELAKRTMALTEKKDPRNLKTYMELLKAWRGMGGAQDYLVAEFHVLTRKLFQDAGYLAAADPKTVETAQEVRARCRAILRNPDGYEIWPNF